MMSLKMRIMSIKVKKVCRWFSASWAEDRVRQILKKYGDIEIIKFFRNMPSAM